MGKKDKNRFTQQPETRPPPPPTGLFEKAKALASEAMAQIIQEAPEAVGDLPTTQKPAPETGDKELRQQLEQALGEAREAREIYELLRGKNQRQQKELEEREARANNRLKELTDERERFERDKKSAIEAQQEERKNLKRDQDKLKADQDKLKADQLALLGEQEKLAKERANAELGFERERRESLAKFEEELKAVKEELARQREQVARERQQWLDEESRLRTGLEQKLAYRSKEVEDVLEGRERELQRTLDARRAELERDRVALRDERHKLSLLERELDDKRALLREDEEDLQARVERHDAGVKEQLRAQVRSLEEQLAAARTQRDEADRLLQQRRETDRRIGGRTPEELHEQLERAERQVNELQLELARKPGGAALEELEKLRALRAQWEDERPRLQQQVRHLQHQLDQARVGVVELEDLRKLNESFLAQNRLLQARLDELRAEVDGLTARQTAVRSFPACSGMDENTDLQAGVHTTKPDHLQEFVEDLRHRIGTDPDGRNFYYTLDDLRLFVAGLATSRLHLLQGISGIGKTSLPREFARAVGAGFRAVDVQSNWRDRQDLLGHYNTFEGKYIETEFLKALYEAGTPSFQDRPFIVLLDEMNLSRPEHYFADLLAQLQQPPERQQLVLMPTPPPNAPKRLTTGVLPLPKNVWFMGTANHDETTVEFADKTYDRAHVTELPSDPKRVPLESRGRRDPVSLSWLRQQFSSARQQHEKEAQAARRLLDDRFAAPLRDRFGITWGDRLRDQLRTFVPVVKASGGSVDMALDHILATRLLRKVRDRHDTTDADLQELEKTLTDWPSKYVPERSLKIVHEERKKRGAR